MGLVHTITSLLTGLGRFQIERLPPAERQQLAAECERVRRLADAPPPPAKNGVLARLHDGERAQ